MAALINELMEFTLSKIDWSRDVTNFAEAPMLIFATLAVAARLGLGNAIAEMTNMERLAIDADIPIWEQQTLSICIVVGVIVNGLRAMCAFPALGPLVMMTWRMIVDVIKWLLIPVIVTIAFVLGFYALHKGSSYAGNSDDDCEVYKSELGGSPLSVVLMLFNPILGADSQLECVTDRHARWPSVNLASPFLMIAYLLLTAVLLLNMLIASTPSAIRTRNLLTPARPACRSGA